LLRSRDEGASVEVLDAAYWAKGCSSLGRLRVAVLLDIGRDSSSGEDLGLMDVKEAIQAAATRYPAVKKPRDNGERVVEGARHLAPFLGDRMRASRFVDRSVFLRELLPQDLKVEINQLTRDEAMKIARFPALSSEGLTPGRWARQRARAGGWNCSAIAQKRSMRPPGCGPVSSNL
jgi:uncharacterized protein (DUF2252 family)